MGEFTNRKPSAGCRILPSEEESIYGHLSMVFALLDSTLGFSDSSGLAQGTESYSPAHLDLRKRLQYTPSYSSMAKITISTYHNPKLVVS